MKKIFLYIFILLFLNSCSTYRGFYDIQLLYGERNISNDFFGEIEYNSKIINNLSTFNIKDKVLDIEISVLDATKFNLIVKNKSNQTIKLIWDNCVFINTSGENSKFIHSGTKFIDKGNPQNPTLILKNTSINDIIIPSNNIYYVTGQYGGWKYKSLFGQTASVISENDLKKQTENYIGKDFIIMLTFEIDSKEVEYTYNLKVNDFKIIK